MRSRSLGGLLLLHLLVALAGCDGGGGDPVDASSVDAGADLDAAAPVDAGATVEDAGSAPADAGTPDAGCAPEADAVLCAAASAECGEVRATDRCGAERTARCGGCLATETCGLDVANRCANAGFVITTIDGDGDVGQEVSLAIDADDVLHVAYRRDGGGISGDLRYARSSASGWVTETIDDDVIAGRHTAIAIDGAGVVHVAAPAGSTTPSRAIDLWTRGASGWSLTMIPGASVGRLDLAFDASARAHLCAYRAPSGGFGGFLSHFAQGSDGTFGASTIDGTIASASSRVGDYCSIAFDGATARASYYDGQFMRLKHAVRAGASWTPEVVDAPAGDGAGDYASMALDATGAPVIAYRFGALSRREIRVARPGAAGWTLVTVDADAGTIANHTAIALDASGRAHVTYFDSRAPGTLRYASETASGFTLADVAVVGTGSGGHSAIALDSTGAVHIVYYDVTTSSLRHATPR